MHKQNCYFLQAEVSLLKQKLSHKKQKHQNEMEQLESQFSKKHKTLMKENGQLKDELFKVSQDLADMQK